MTERLTDEQLTELGVLDRSVSKDWSCTFNGFAATATMRTGKSSWTVPIDQADELMLATGIRNALPSLLAEVRELRRQLQWERDHACENTPAPGCDCPGCSLIREEATK